jgi:hypothetical protein
MNFKTSGDYGLIGEDTMSYQIKDGLVYGMNNNVSQSGPSKGGIAFELDFIPRNVSYPNHYAYQNGDKSDVSQPRIMFWTEPAGDPTLHFYYKD